MSFRWSEESTLKFISKYLEHECLWNLRSQTYKNKEMKQFAYLNLESLMNNGFGSSAVLHEFPNPAKDMDSFKKWLSFVGDEEILKLSHEYVHKNRRICRKHFEYRFLCRFNRLSKIAVPTIKMPCSSDSQMTLSGDTQNVPADVPSTLRVSSTSNAAELRAFRQIHNLPKVENVCRSCLKSTNELSLMPADLAMTYKSFVGEVAHEEIPLKSCLICKWMLRKISNFKLQCEAANGLLKEVVYSGTVKPFELQTIINMSQAEMETHSYIPLQIDITCQNDRTNDTLIKSETHFIVINDDKNADHSNDAHTNDCCNDVKNDTFNSDVLNDEFVDCNDDIPLVLLKRKTKKKRKKKVQPDNEIIVEQTDAKKSTKRKKQLRDGFTSRMVQETDQYIVIKLTKEQVLKEMEDRSKTESYTRSLYKCEKCVKGFNFVDVLQTHLQKHSTNNGTFECEMCGQYCPSAVSLRGHIKSHTTRYKCKLCGQIRLSRQHLLEHYAITHTNEAATYKCDCCEFTTNKRTVMQRHVRAHGASTHECGQCSKTFKTVESLRLHTLRHASWCRRQCGACAASFVYPSLLTRHVAAVHQRRDYYCVECDVQFNSSESLRLHFKKAKRHRDPSTYKHECNDCSERFFARSSLLTHQCVAHGAAKAYQCEHCHRRYSTRDALRAHKARAHPKQKPDYSVEAEE